MKCEFEACRHMLSLTQVDFLLLSDAYSLLSSEPGRLGGFQYPTYSLFAGRHWSPIPAPNPVQFTRPGVFASFAPSHFGITSSSLRIVSCRLV